MCSSDLNGLGQTVSNLRINTPAGDSTGLFGGTNGATITNLNLAAVAITGGNNTGGLVGFATNTAISNVTVSGTVTGQNTTGGLLGAQTGGTTTNATSTATVAGTDNTGGLIGVMDGGTLTRGIATGQVTGGAQVGGLIGIAQSAAIQQSFATGGVTGTDLVGGLIGGFSGEGTTGATGVLLESYANGAVTSQARGGGLIGLVSNNSQIGNAYATGLTRAGTFAGGLIGELNTVVAPGSPGLPSAIVNTYATGLVTGAGVRGGLVGNVVGAVGTVTNSYWDTQTSGVATSAGPGATGLTTAQLQGTLPGGFTGASFATQANAYPYLTWRFPAGILAISGFTRGAADPGTPIAAEPVRVAAGGLPSYQTNSGANGYYYIARDPLTGAAPQGATAYLDGGNRGSATTDAPIGPGAITNLDPRIGRALVTTVQPTTSGLTALLTSAGDSTVSPNILYTVAANGVPTFGSGLPTFVESLAPGGLTVDRSLISTGNLQVAGLGSTASAGPITIAAGQQLRSLTGDVVIATAGFTNASDANAVQAGGRFLIYSQDYAADQRGALAATNLYARSFLGNPPTTVTQGGSQFIFTRQPVLTLSVTDANRLFGAGPLGFTRTVAGLVNGDTAAQAFTGTTTVTDTTNAATPAGTYPGAAVVGQGSVLSSIGYALNFVNAPVTIGAVAPPPVPPVPPTTIDPLTIALTTPTLDRQQPTTFIPANDPPDEIVSSGITDVVGGNGGGGSGGPTLGSGVFTPTLTTRVAATDVSGAGGEDTQDYLEAAGRELDAATASCEQRTDRRDKTRVQQYNDCVARALEVYADKLEARIAQLPPALQNIPSAVRIPAALGGGRAVSLRSVPSVIRAAARQVRASRTVAQARNVVRAAVSVIRKAITLIRADEPASAARQVRQGNAIVGALSSCEARIGRAVGL